MGVSLYPALTWSTRNGGERRPIVSVRFVRSLYVFFFSFSYTFRGKFILSGLLLQYVKSVITSVSMKIFNVNDTAWHFLVEEGVPP